MNELDKKHMRVAVLCGGFEPEHYASTLTGQNIATALRNSGFGHVAIIEVDTQIVDRLQVDRPDFVFLALFCKWGEDGIIQGLLETLEIPYSGSGLEASALCNNKYLFTLAAKAIAIPVPKTIRCRTEVEANQIVNQFSLPFIVKPVYQGYSLGVRLVENEQEINGAIAHAFRYSTEIVIQQYIPGRELTVGVVDVPGKGAIVLPIIELKMKKPIQDTEVKDDCAAFMEEIIPAQLTRSVQRKIERLTLKLYQTIGCLGTSRFDLRLDKDDCPFFLENNTCPGILNYAQSDLPKQLDAAGISLEAFVDYMVITGLNRKPMKLDSQED